MAAFTLTLANGDEITMTPSHSEKGLKELIDNSQTRGAFFGNNHDTDEEEAYPFYGVVRVRVAEEE